MDKVQLLNFNSVNDFRGVLTSVEFGIDLDFEIKRIFYLHRIHGERGGHAHIDTDQVLICMSGSLDIELVYNNQIFNFHLDNPEFGITIPRLTFVTMRNFSLDACVLVLANTHYDYSKSLRNFEDFNNYLKQKNVH